MTNRTKSEFTSHSRISAKTNFLMLLLFSARFAHARYSSRMIDRFLNWGDHGKPKSGKIRGRCQPPLVASITFSDQFWLPPNKGTLNFVCLSRDIQLRYQSQESAPVKLQGIYESHLQIVTYFSQCLMTLTLG